MAVNQLQSLKTFILNHPPLVVFTVCFFLFGLTTITLAFIVGRSDLPNPDITMVIGYFRSIFIWFICMSQDWNVFLSHLTQRNLCVHARNLSEHQNPFSKKSSMKSQVLNSTTNTTVSTSSEPLIGVEQLSLSELLPDISSLKLGKSQTGPSINVTKSMVVPLTFDAGMLKLPLSVTWLRGRVTGRHVGYTGQLSKESIHVNMFLPNNIKKEKFHCQGKPDCKITLRVCMVFFGPASVIPKTKQYQGCRHWTDDVKHEANTTWYLPGYIPKQCAGKTQLKIQYNSNPSLTAMLNNVDKSIVNLHLMHTSYLIFILVITMLCYAVVRSYFRNTFMLNLEKVNV